MGLFDGTIKKFAVKMVERCNAYADALDEQGKQKVEPHNQQMYYTGAMTLRLVGRIITEVSEAE